MYLLTSTNVQESGYEIVVANDSKAVCNEKYEELQKKVWFNEDGSKKMFSDIYDDTRAKNAFIVSNKRAEELFGGKSKLQMAVDYMHEF